MADNTPTRLGQINNTGLEDSLFLKVFAEVLGAFRKTTQFMGRTYVREIQNGKSAQFPLIGRAVSNYHVPGQEITGQAIPQNEKIITLDGLLISPVSIADIDEAMNHYDVRREFTAALGEALAQTFDMNIARTAIQAARAAGWHTSMPGGTAIESATMKTDAAVLAASIFQANVAMDENFVPETDRSAYVKPLQYSLLSQNQNLQNSMVGGAGMYLDGKLPKIGSSELVKSTNLPIANVTGSYKNKYDVVAATTAGLVIHRNAVGTVKLMDIQLQSEYSVRRQSTLMVSRMAVGHGILRPESAVELRTGAPT